MSGNEIEGGARELGGRIKDAAGGLTGNAKTQSEGKLDQVAGQAQQQYGDAIDALTESVRQRPVVALLIAAGVGWLIGRTI